MSTTVEKLQKVLNTKNALKEKINEKGGNITDNTPFADYVNELDNISSGADPILLDLIEGREVNLVIPKEATKIAKNAFENDSYIKTITIPSTITEIGERGFFGSAILETVSIEEGITYLAKNMFAGCTKLKTINIPRTVTNFDYCVFNSCTSLTYLFVTKNVKTFNSYCMSIGSASNLATIRMEHETPPTIPK